jgi:hypothetical protein
MSSRDEITAIHGGVLVNRRIARSKFAVAGVGLFASAALALSGCNGTTATPTANSSSTDEGPAATALTSAVTKLKTIGYDVSLTERLARQAMRLSR